MTKGRFFYVCRRALSVACLMFLGIVGGGFVFGPPGMIGGGLLALYLVGV